MKQLRALSLASLGLALAAVVAPSAQAQGNSRVIVCRDGSRFDSTNASVCSRHNGVDGRATQIARRNDRWDDRRDQRDDRRDEQDDRRDRRDDGRYGNNDGRYGNNDGRYGTGNSVTGRSAVYQFQGTVDKEIRIQLRGDRASVQPMGEGDYRASRGGRMMNGLPRQDGNLVIERLAGRGDIDVLEQPSSRNGYTATLRIRDSKGGADNYRFVAYFQPVNSGYGDRGRWNGN